ncbi:MAG: NHL repeat-containing protein [Myxococcales bacterium]|nr:NHL repeat-containing protein [Myxococcales bacterium]
MSPTKAVSRPHGATGRGAANGGSDSGAAGAHSGGQSASGGVGDGGLGGAGGATEPEPAGAGGAPQGGAGGAEPALFGDGVPEGLQVEHVPQYPTRIARGPGATLFVSDFEVGSIFISDAAGALLGELKNVGEPLGVAVAGGRIYVGSRASRAVDVYSTSGDELMSIDAGNLSMPNDLAIDASGRLYVAESSANEVRVYDTGSGVLLDVLAGSDAANPFVFPSAVAIGDGELFVADQGTGRIVVFDLGGNFRREIGERIEAFQSDWHGRFVRLQSLATDGAGHVFALDSRLCVVQVLDAADGAYLGHLGAQGSGDGEIYLPLDVELAPDGMLAITDSGNVRVSRFDPQAAEP